MVYTEFDAVQQHPKDVGQSLIFSVGGRRRDVLLQLFMFLATWQPAQGRYVHRFNLQLGCEVRRLSDSNQRWRLFGIRRLADNTAVEQRKRLLHGSLRLTNWTR